MVFEWREGGSEFTASRMRRLLSRCFSDMPTQFKSCSDSARIPTVALPHGHTALTTLVRTDHVKEVLAANDGKLPFADRDSYSAYVFGSEYHRKVILENSNMAGSNTQVWGSARYNSYWVNLVYRHVVADNSVANESNSLRKVLFFLPKWFNLIDRRLTVELLSAICEAKAVSLIVRAHARGDDSGLTLDEKRILSKFSTIKFVPTNVSSQSLIKACDVLVDVDSSIAFDAVLLNKPYVRPRYLQDASVRTIWDELGGAHQTDSCEATVALLTQAMLQPAPRDATFDDVVFGGSGEIVLDRYRDELRALANR